MYNMMQTSGNYPIAQSASGELLDDDVAIIERLLSLTQLLQTCVSRSTEKCLHLGPCLAGLREDLQTFLRARQFLSSSTGSNNHMPRLSVTPRLVLTGDAGSEKAETVQFLASQVELIRDRETTPTRGAANTAGFGTSNMGWSLSSGTRGLGAADAEELTSSGGGVVAHQNRLLSFSLKSGRVSPSEGIATRDSSPIDDGSSATSSVPERPQAHPSSLGAAAPGSMMPATASVAAESSSSTLAAGVGPTPLRRPSSPRQGVRGSGAGSGQFPLASSTSAVVEQEDSLSLLRKSDSGAMPGRWILPSRGQYGTESPLLSPPLEPIRKIDDVLSLSFANQTGKDGRRGKRLGEGFRRRTLLVAPGTFELSLAEQVQQYVQQQMQQQQQRERQSPQRRHQRAISDGGSPSRVVSAPPLSERRSSRSVAGPSAGAADDGNVTVPTPTALTAAAASATTEGGVRSVTVSPPSVHPQPPRVAFPKKPPRSWIRMYVSPGRVSPPAGKPESSSSAPPSSVPLSRITSPSGNVAGAKPRHSSNPAVSSGLPTARPSRLPRMLSLLSMSSLSNSPAGTSASRSNIAASWTLRETEDCVLRTDTSGPLPLPAMLSLGDAYGVCIPCYNATNSIAIEQILTRFLFGPLCAGVGDTRPFRRTRRVASFTTNNQADSLRPAPTPPAALSKENNPHRTAGDGATAGITGAGSSGSPHSSGAPSPPPGHTSPGSAGQNSPSPAPPQDKMLVLRECVLEHTFFILTGIERLPGFHDTPVDCAVTGGADGDGTQQPQPQPAVDSRGSHQLSDVVAVFIEEVRNVFGVVVHPWQVIPFSSSFSQSTFDFLSSYSRSNLAQKQRLKSAAAATGGETVNTTTINTVPSPPPPAVTTGCGGADGADGTVAAAVATAEEELNPAASSSSSSKTLTQASSSTSPSRHHVVPSNNPALPTPPSTPPMARDRPRHTTSPPPSFPTAVCDSPAAAGPVVEMAVLPIAVVPRAAADAAERFLRVLYGDEDATELTRGKAPQEVETLALREALGGMWASSGAQRMHSIARAFEQNSFNFILSQIALSLLFWSVELQNALPLATNKARAKLRKLQGQLARIQVRSDSIDETITTHQNVMSPYASVNALRQGVQDVFAAGVQRFLRDVRRIVLQQAEPVEVDVGASASVRVAYERLAALVRRSHEFYTQAKVDERFRLHARHMRELDAKVAESARQYAQQHPECAAAIYALILPPEDGDENEGGGGGGGRRSNSSSLSAKRRTSATGGVSWVLTGSSTRGGGKAADRKERVRLLTLIDPAYLPAVESARHEHAKVEKQVVLMLSQINTEIINFFLAVCVSQLLPVLESAAQEQLWAAHDRYAQLLQRFALTRPHKQIFSLSRTQEGLATWARQSPLVRTPPAAALQSLVTDMRAALTEDAVRGLAMYYRWPADAPPPRQVAKYFQPSSPATPRTPQSPRPENALALAAACDAEDPLAVSTNSTSARADDDYLVGFQCARFVRKRCGMPPTFGSTGSAAAGPGAGGSSHSNYQSPGVMSSLQSPRPSRDLLSAGSFDAMSRNSPMDSHIGGASGGGGGNSSGIALAPFLAPEEDSTPFTAATLPDAATLSGRRGTAAFVESPSSNTTAGRVGWRPDGDLSSWRERLRAWRAATAPEARPTPESFGPKAALWLLADVWDECLLQLPVTAVADLGQSRYARELNEISSYIIGVQYTWQNDIRSLAATRERQIRALEEDIAALHPAAVSATAAAPDTDVETAQAAGPAGEQHLSVLLSTVAPGSAVADEVGSYRSANSSSTGTNSKMCIPARLEEVFTQANALCRSISAPRDAILRDALPAYWELPTAPTQ